MAQVIPNSESETVIQIEDAGPVTVPGGAKLLTAEFFREGDDLMIVNQDGSQVRVEDYFGAGQAPDLSTGASVISGHTVSLFAQSIGGTDPAPQAQQASLGEPAGLAQSPDGSVASEPIAEISDIDGEVIVIRADGSRVAGHEGTPLYEDDIVTTGEDSTAGLRFVDEMTFSLGSNARMLLDDFTYEPEAGEGGGFLSVLQGAFSFVSGEAAHFGLDSLKIETPTMTIGVRGTKVAVQAAAEGETSRIALLAEDDGTIGKIMVTTDAGQELLSEANTMVEVVSRFQPPSAQMQISSDQMYQHFGASLSSLPKPDYNHDPAPAQDAASPPNTAPSGTAEAISFAQSARGHDFQDPAGLGLQDLGSENQTPATQPSTSIESGDAAPAFRPGTTLSTEAEESTVSVDPLPIIFPEEPALVEIAPATVAVPPPAPVAPPSAMASPATSPAPAEETEQSPAAETAAPPAPPAVNRAPELDTTGDPTLIAIAEDIVAPAGNTVAQIVIDGSVTDLDGNPLEAIALTGADNANGTWQYSTDGGTTFNAVGAVSDNAAILLDAAAVLRFVPNGNYNGTATITYRAWDQSSGNNGQTGVDVSVNGGATAFSAASETAALTVTPVNDAPILDTSGTPNLTAIANDTVNPTGNTIGQIVIDGLITDPDGIALEAVAVTGVDDSNGTWEYSIDGGATFNAIGAVADSSALLLDQTALVRFVPNAGFVGNATFTYRAWDQSSGSNGQNGVDVSVNGGTSAFGTAVEAAMISVTASNSAPVLDTSGAPTLTAIAEDTAAPAGQTVGQIVIDGSITDPDGPVEAIAVTGVDDTNGTWQSSTDGGTTFTAIGGVSDTSALLLDSSAIIRFVPNADFNGNATFSYRAWDQSSGTNGQGGVNVSVNGGTTGYSMAVETAAITVTAVNDAPVLDTAGSPTLTNVPENSTAPNGDSVAQIVTDGSITDADGSAVEAIALTGADNTNGAWQFSTDGGTTFNAVGAVSDNAAILLNSAAVLRFVPNASYNGSASITYRAWDQTSGSNGQTGVDVSVNGGITAFSAASETAAITVVPNPNAPQATSANVLNFEGTNSYVDVGDPGTGSDQLDPKTGDFTVEAWFYYGGPEAGQQTIVGKGNHPHTKDGYSIFLDNGELVVRLNATGSSSAHDTAAASITMPAGTGWHHVAMVIDQGPGALGSTITGYLDGSSAGWTSGFGSVSDNLFTAPGGGIDSDKDFLIGATQNNGGNPVFYFDAEIADVRVWSQARSQTEIASGLGEDLAGDETGLIANWRMNEGSGTTISDNTALGLDGTAVGGPAWDSGTSFTIVQDSVLDGRVSAVDPDGDQLTYSVSASASNGTATIDATTGTWEYTPDGGFTGNDSFSYQVSDGGNTDTVNIDVTVTP